MKYSNKKILFAILSAAILLGGCKKGFLDINQDPNRVTDDNVTPELIFAAAAEGTGATNIGLRANGAGARGPMQFAQNWIGYMASNGDFAREQTETSYDIDFGFGNVLFTSRYNVLFDLHQAEVKGLASGDTAIAGASIILSAKIFQELTDLFGNIPYTEAFKVKETTRPIYDKAPDIYASLQRRLDTAINYLQLTPPVKFETADIVNNGDTEKWIKFANTLKLRLLIRQSEMPGFDPSAEITKIMANGGVLGVGESISVNPGYSNDVDKQSPFYANYGFTPTGNKATTSFNANEYILNILSSSSDPRIGRFFTKAGSNYIGCVYGDDPGNIPGGSSCSYFGPALIKSPAQDQWIMPSYESLFLKAEAIARGWMPGNEVTAYQDAVTESFTWLGVPNAATEAASYMSNEASANWINAGTTALSKAKFIAFQKYIANTCIDALESYSDQRRLHFLTDNSYISVNPSRVSNMLPLRLLYPQSEYTTNGENVLKEGTIDPFSSKLFWEP